VIERNEFICAAADDSWAADDLRGSVRGTVGEVFA
jgi:hypothetical protein